ncbi:MAG: 3-oxoacyl-[acyl-carrier-protein] reductase [Acidobacteria bacterium]|nr:3-oxoacyl-[acyl-carrier-protein] reductase [Acidobacteriota bacterium]
MLMLTGRVALVTGASRGIGKAIALSLASGGATVIAAARGTNAQSTVDAIVAAGGTAELASLDVTDPASVELVTKDVLARHGRIDVLVNNAGVTRDQLLLRMKREDWDAVIGANLTGAFTCVQAVLKSMVKARHGRIISITSVVGEAGNAGQANYAASKAGLIGFTKALAQEVASRGITVNAVAPGMIETDMTKAISEGAHDEWAKKIPLQRLGTPEDVAAAVRFLASDEAAYITGHVLAVNGGMRM